MSTQIVSQLVAPAPCAPVTLVLAWRFAEPNGISEYQKTPQVVGEKYRVSTKQGIVPANFGYHGSVNPLAALRYGQRFNVERVALSGMVVQREGDDKAAASERTVLWRADAKNVILIFGAECAERALTRRKEAGRTTDPRSWAAVEAIRGFVAGTVTIAQMRSAASDADAAYVADAVSAAYVASAAAAASAAYVAARSAAYVAARSAASAAYVADAAYAASVDARQAERDWQRETLHARLMELAPVGYQEAETEVQL